MNIPQKEYKLIFYRTEAKKYLYVRGKVTKDNRFLVISASNTTSGNNLYLKDLSDENSEIVPIIESDEANTHVLTTENNTLYLVTDLDAPNRRVVTVDVDNLSPENWTDFIAETENVLSASTAEKYVFEIGRAHV